MTAALTHSEAWHAERLQGIGSSDAPIILGLTSHFETQAGDKATPRVLWAEKTEQRPREDLDNDPKVKWGKILEGYVADVVADSEPDWKVRRKTVTVWSSTWTWAYAHLDRIVNDGVNGGIPLEIKTTGLEGDWGPAWTQDIPRHVMAQVQHQLAATGKPYAYVAVFILVDRDLRVYRIERNDTYIATMMAKECDFWTCVLDRVPPEPINASDVIALFPDPTGTIEADEHAALLCANYNEGHHLEKRGKDLKAEMKDELAVVFGEANVLVSGNRTLATYNREKRSGLNEARLKAERPEIFAEYYETGYTRVMRVK